MPGGVMFRVFRFTAHDRGNWVERLGPDCPDWTVMSRWFAAMGHPHSKLREHVNQLLQRS